ncbi:ATP-binding protein [Paenibacillus protaetiae]|uniref:histidine kinase n=1 Tax=Paenibacillus protaetiae TaxID=2509456 RepID=A0A4P6FC07_9BACL|nr:ATP-binding protein [Paenibacillus protaetiae]QAY68088.1 hypothetical protein ET464_18660 [Paenibacillus protaetiae]
MIKELLLQFVVALFPAVVYQLWHDSDKHSNRGKLYICAASGVSMLVCLLLCYDFHGFDIDFGIVPYLTGSLYGGVPGIVVLSGIYVLTRAPMLQSAGETIAFVSFLGLFMLALFKLYPLFNAANAKNKLKISTSIISAAVGFNLLASTLYLDYTSVNYTPQIIAVSFLSIISCLAGSYFSVFIIESLRRNRLLEDEIRLVSANYSNQVEALQQFINETAFAVLLVDHNGRLTHINELGMKLFALMPNDGSIQYFIGWPYETIFQPPNSAICVHALSKALKGERTVQEPIIGEKYIYLKTAFPLYAAAEKDDITGAALIVQDITEITRLRNEVGRMERLSLVGQMAASITHEIRNPMAVIRGFVQLIRERSPADQQQYFRIVMEELDRTNSIINDFLSLAQNRALTMELGSLNELILQMAPLLEADANMRGQSVVLTLQEQLPPMMMNEKEIKQLLLNIARNGMEAMGDAGILHIETRSKPGIVELLIRDEGIGIPQEKIKQLFDPFFTTKQRGTGLGLSLCLSIAERHSGQIDVESSPGAGTTFIVAFNISRHKGEAGRAYYGTSGMQEQLRMEGGA